MAELSFETHPDSRHRRSIPLSWCLCTSPPRHWGDALNVFANFCEFFAPICVNLPIKWISKHMISSSICPLPALTQKSDYFTCWELLRGADRVLSYRRLVKLRPYFTWPGHACFVQCMLYLHTWLLALFSSWRRKEILPSWTLNFFWRYKYRRQRVG